MTAWSYSSIKTFEQCPRKYYHLRVLKDVKDEGSEATVYGTEVHKAAEDYVKHGVPIPKKYSYIEHTVRTIKAIPGVKHTELKLGLRKTGHSYEPCGFFDANVWWRGVADVVVVNETLGFSIDYKTGKNARYADTKQIDLVAGALFVHFPELLKIKSALAYLVTGDFLPKTHIVTEKSQYLSVFDEQLDGLAAAEVSGVWNAKSGPLCSWCPVRSCENWRPRRK